MSKNLKNSTILKNRTILNSLYKYFFVAAKLQKSMFVLHEVISIGHFIMSQLCDSSSVSETI